LGKLAKGKNLAPGLGVWATRGNYPILGKIAVCIESSDFDRNTAPIGSVERKMRRFYGWRCYPRVTSPAIAAS
jgi:hypothetical protein